MAKRTTKLLQYRSEKQSHKYSQGMGYHIPHGMNAEEWADLRRTWEAKLQKSNFPDIEQFSHDFSGHFSPFFTKTDQIKSRSGSSATEASQYRPDVAEFYRRVGIFRHHADLLTIFKHQAYLYTFILEMLSDGTTYQEMVNWLRKKAPRPLKATKSIYWAFYHVKNIEEAMKKWFKDNPDMCD